MSDGSGHSRVNKRGESMRQRDTVRVHLQVEAEGAKVTQLRC